MKFFTSNINKNILVALLAAAFILSLVSPLGTALAQFNPEINYQGKLTDSTGAAVLDGTYNMNFWLVPTSGGATSTAVWSEARTGANRVQVTNGLFSVMLGDVSSLAGVDFNQTLYLAVEIGGTGTPVWDGELLPRKILGAVPAAFVAETANSADALSGIASSSFLRSDEVDTMTASSSSSLLTLVQNGVGKVLSLFSGATEIFTALSNGNIGIGTTTPTQRLSVGATTGSQFLVSSTGVVSDGTWNADAIGAIYGGTGLTSVNQNQLLIGGAGNTWSQVATSSLGLYGVAADSITSAQLLSSVTNETGTGALVFGTSPTFTTQITSPLVVGGTAAGSNLSLKSTSGVGTTDYIRFLVGNNGGTEAMRVTNDGYLGIGTPTPSSLLDVGGFSTTNYTMKTGTLGLQSYSLNNGLLGENSYYVNGDGWKRMATGYASSIHLFQGQTMFNTANTGTGDFTQTLPLKATWSNSGSVALGGNIDVYPTNFTGASMVVLGTGNVGIGTTTPSQRLSVGATTGSQFLVSSAGVVTDGTWNADVIGGAYGGTGLSSVTQNQLLIGGAGNTWSQVATSSLGLSASFSTSAQLASLLSDEVGTGGGFVRASSTMLTSPVLITPNLGTPSAGVLTNATGLPVSTGIAGLGTGVATFLATPSSANLISAVTDETGTGALVFGNSPTFTGTIIAASSTLSGNFSVSGTSTLATTTASTLSIAGALRDSSASAGTVGMVLQTTGSGTQWVATSSLGLGNGTFLGLTDTPSSYTANRIIFTNSGATALTDSANLTFDGSSLRVGSQSRIGFGGTDYIYASSTSDSIAFGQGAGASFTNNTTYNVAIGFDAGGSASNANVDFNNFIGVYAGLNNTGSSTNIIGYGAGYSNGGSRSNIIGVNAGYSNSGSYNNLIGYNAGYINDGSYNEMIGSEAGRYVQSNRSVFLGSDAYRGSGTFQADNVVALGYRAGYLAQTGASNNILLGYQAADNLTTGNNNIVIGYDIDNVTATADNQLNIGNLIFGTGLDGTGTTLASGNVGIGTSTPGSKLTVAGDLRLTGAFRDTNNASGTAGMVLQTTGAGTQWVATSSLGFTSGATTFLGLTDTPSSFTANRIIFTNSGATALTDSADFTYDGTNLGLGAGKGLAINGIRMFSASSTKRNIGIGQSALSSNLANGVGDDNVAIGHESLMSNSSGENNTAVGTQALYTNSSGVDNAAYGYNALYANNTGNSNSAFGTQASLFNTTGSYNTANGTQALYANTTGSYNTALGALAGYDINTAASTGANTIIGYNTGRGITTGVNNTIIGANVTGLSSTLSNNIIIADGAGNRRINVDSSGNVGIGTTTPGSSLSVVGTTTLTGALDLSGDIAISGTLRAPLLSPGRILYVTTDNYIIGNSGFVFTGTNFGLGTSSPSQMLTVGGTAGSQFLVSSTGVVSDGTWNADAIGATYGGTGLTSVTQNQLLIGGAGNTWSQVATSSLGLSASFTTSAELAALLSDEVGTDGGFVRASSSMLTSPILVTPNLGTPSAGVLTNATGLPVATGIAGLGTGVATFLGTPSSANLISAVTDETGTGSLVFANSPTLTGTLSGANASFSGTLGVSGTSTLATTTASTLTIAGALRDSSASAGTSGMVLQTTGTSTRWTATSTLGLYGTTASSITSAQLLSSVSNETGTGVLVFGTSPTFTTQITAPQVVGGTAAASNLTLKSTSGVGTSDYVRITVGNNGATEALRAITSGNIGIGTTTPGRKLTVAGDIFATGAFRDSTNASGTAGMVLQTTGSGTAWVATSSLGITGGGGSSLFTDAGATTYLTATGDNLGIGTTTAGSRLTVDGDINLTGAIKFNNVSAIKSSSGNVVFGEYALPNSNSNIYSNTVLGELSANNLVSGSTNVFLGFYAGRSLSTSTSNVVIGDRAAGESEGGYEINNAVIIGRRAGYNLEGNYYHTFIGDAAGENVTTGGENTLIGNQAGSSITTGSSNIVLGSWSTTGITTGDNNVIIGNNISGLSSSLANNIIIADGAGNRRINVDSSGNVGIGTTTQSSKLTIAGDIFATGALRDSTNSAGTAGMVLQTTGSGTQWVATSSLGITGGGGATTFLALTDTPSSFTANRIMYTNSGATALVDSADFVFTGTNLGIGTSTPGSRLTIAGDAYLTGAFRDSSNASGTLGMVLQSTGTSTRWVATSTLGITGGGGGSLFTDAGATTYLTSTADNLSIGTTTSSGLLTVDGTIAALDGIKFGGQRSVFIDSSSNMTFGEWALFYAENNANVYSNIGIGDNAGNNLRSGFSNVIMGFSAGANMATGSRSVVIGDHAVGNNPGVANIGAMVVIGDGAGQDLEDGANWQTLVGYRAGENITTGSGNTIFGYQAGNNITTGWENIVIGYDIDAPSASSNNTLNIGNIIFGNSIDGTGTTISSGNIGIGTSTPNAKLTVKGSGSNIFALYSSTATTTMLVESDGEVGFGATPNAQMTIFGKGQASAALTNSGNKGGILSLVDDNTSSGSGGAIVFGNSQSKSYGSLGHAAIKGLLVDGTNNTVGHLAFSTRNGTGDTSLTERMRIEYGGNVAIGTTTAAQKLQVWGNIRVGTSGTNGCLERFDGTALTGTCSSDEDLKTNINALATDDRSYLEGIAALNPVTYQWNEVAEDLYKRNTETTAIGLIAQEVEIIFPELVSIDDKGFRQVDLASLPFYIIQAIKEIWTKLTDQQEKIDELEQRIQYLESLQSGGGSGGGGSNPPPTPPAPTVDEGGVDGGGEDLPPEETLPPEEIPPSEETPPVEEILPNVDDTGDTSEDLPEETPPEADTSGEADTAGGVSEGGSEASGGVG